MPKGRKPKPAALRVIEGTRGKRPIPQEPQGRTLTRPPKAPAALGRYGNAMWRKLSTELVAATLLQGLDYYALQAACLHWQYACEARDRLRDEGITQTDDKGNLHKHPCEVIFRQNLQAFHSWCGDFGLSPAARARLGAVQEEAQDDPFAEWMKRGSDA